MAEKNKSRKYQVTINNPIKYGMTHTKIKEIVPSIGVLVYWCMTDEIGSETNTYHTHIFIYFKNDIQFSTIKKYFPQAHIEIAKATPFHNREYIFKSGKWENSHKEDTKVEGTQEEFGEVPERTTQKKFFDTLVELVNEGKDDLEIINTNPSYLLYLNKIAELRNLQHKKEFSTKRRLDLEVHYIWGDSRSGKSRSVRDAYGDENVYSVDDYKYPFDDYDGENIIIFEEFRSDLELKNMLKYLDVYPLKLHSRYNNKIACYTKVYIISNIPLEKQFTDIQTKEPQSWEAFVNRINDIQHFQKDTDGTVSIETIAIEDFKTKHLKKK